MAVLRSEIVVAASFVACALTWGCGLDWTVPERNDGSGAGSGGASSGSSSSADSSTSSSASTSTTGTTTATTTTTTSSSATSGRGGGPVDCESLGSCEACVSCGEEGLCKGVVDACYADVECSYFDDCQWQCPDILCVDNCEYQYPNGANLWYGAAYCINCDACHASCPGSCESL